MLAENGLEVDARALRHVFETGDVITVGFTLLVERLLIDTRRRPDEGALVAIVAPVATVQERYLWLGAHRGNFGAPKNFAFVAWPHTVRNLAERDIIRPLWERLASVGEGDEVALDNAIERLLEAERQAMREAVRGGDSWSTTWAR